MDDLIAFVAARLDEDEAAAKKAVPGPWRWADWSATFGTLEQERNTLEHSPGSRPFPAVAERDRETTRVLRLEDPLEIDPDQEASADHIARHDPARALRQVEDGRRLLAAYAEAREPDPEATPQERALRMAVAEVVRMLVLSRAAVWSDHPDYKWAP